MNKKITINLAAAIAIICVAVTFSITMILSMRIFDSTVSSVREKEIMYNKIAEIDKVVRAGYDGTIDDDTLYDMLSAGYMAGIGDRNAVYYTAAQYATYLGLADGSVTGIGVDVVKDAGANAMRITRLEAGSPAETAGLAKNMFITKVDNASVSGLTAAQATGLLRGEQGTTVDVSYKTTITGEETTVTLRRVAYTVSTISSSYTNGDSVGYIRIYSFGSTTASEIDRAVRTMEKNGAQALVFDVRGNANSNLDYACDAVDLLCPTGVFAKVRSTAGEETVRGTSDVNCVDLPMVVLMNENTSGAAEMFAVALKDLNGAQTVGVTTAGKWSVQCTPQRLSDGSAVAFTIGYLYSNTDTCYDGTGVTPDMESTLSEDELKHQYEFTVEDDPQIKRAFTVASSLITKAGAQTGDNSAVSGSSDAGDSATIGESITIGESVTPESSSVTPEGSSVATEGSSVAPESGSATSESSTSSSESSSAA